VGCGGKIEATTSPLLKGLPEPKNKTS